MEPFVAPEINDEYLAYAGLLLAHHNRLCAGEDESPETEAIERALTAGWDQLDEPQRVSLSGLGSDQNWVGRNGVVAPRAPRRVSPEDARLLFVALKEKDWHAVLHYLRVCQCMITPKSLAAIRAAAWMGLDQYDIAKLFLDFAAELKSRAS